ncbi:MAG: hypothetical protein PHY94_05445 [Candidatus Omnitrophica bacterium]|nr:hypothetical protein [Candidatus Omnitrophota bacterium]
MRCNQKSGKAGAVSLDTIWTIGIIIAAIVFFVLFKLGVKRNVAFGIGYGSFFFCLFGLCAVKCGRVLLGKGTRPDGAPYQGKDKVMAVIAALMTMVTASLFVWIFSLVITSPR